MSDNRDNDRIDQQTFTLFPPGTAFFEPDPIHQVTIQFPDESSAISFFEWCRQIIIDTEKAGYTEEDH